MHQSVEFNLKLQLSNIQVWPRPYNLREQLDSLTAEVCRCSFQFLLTVRSMAGELAAPLLVLVILRLEVLGVRDPLDVAPQVVLAGSCC